MADLPASIGFRVTRLLFHRDRGVVRFAPSATPAAAYRCGVHLPPARCWSDPSHVPPVPSCRCGYHCFTAFDSAVEYAELFTGPPSFIPVRFTAACVPFSVCDRLPSGAPIRGAKEFRTGSLEYVALARPPRCVCGARSVGVAPLLTHADRLDESDAAAGWVPLTAACRRHLDPRASSVLSSMLPVLTTARLRRSFPS